MKKATQYTVYGLLDPRSEQITTNIRYVGRTKHTLNTRLYGHVGSAKDGVPSPVYKWIRELLTEGVKPVICVLRSGIKTKEKANYYERHYADILRISANQPLLNRKLPGLDSGEKKPVVAYYIDGSYHSHYESAAEAGMALGIDPGNIGKACRSTDMIRVDEFYFEYISDAGLNHKDKFFKEVYVWDANGAPTIYPTAMAANYAIGTTDVKSFFRKCTETPSGNYTTGKVEVNKKDLCEEIFNMSIPDMLSNITNQGWTRIGKALKINIQTN